MLKIYKGLDAITLRAQLEEAGFFEYVEAFETAVNFSRAVKEAGGRALLVGGGIRDELLGKPVKDFDIEVYKLSPNKVKEIISRFGPINEVGEMFAVLKLRAGNVDIDISLPRRESKIGKGHKDFSVSADPNMSIKEAARRRDFTFNSIAKDILTGEIYDYFGGVEDLRKKILRITDEKLFKDDPLRVLRAVQFIGRMGLSADAKSAEIIRGMVGELKHLPKERLKEEWFKLFLKSREPSVGLKAAMDFGIFHEMHADIIPPLVQTPQEPEWHPEGDVWTHNLMVVDEAKKVSDRENLEDRRAIIVMLGAFCHDFGKPSTTEEIDGRIRSRGHEEAGVEPSKKFLSQIGIEESLIEPVLKIVKEHLKPAELYRLEMEKDPPVLVSDGTIRRLAQRLYPATIEELVWVAEADHNGRGLPEEWAKKTEREEYAPGKWLLERARRLEVEKSKPQPLIRGKDLIALGFEPGIVFGRIIKTGDELRDEKGWTRDKLIDLINENEEKGLEEILEILERELKKT